MKIISILGCGWLGTALAIHFLSKRFIVRGSTRSNQKLKQLEAIGIESFLIDIKSPQGSSFFESDYLIIAITCKDNLAIKQFSNFLADCNVKKIIFISSTSVYLAQNKVVTEESPINNNSLTYQFEQSLTKQKSFHTSVLRFGGLFGSERNPTSFFREDRPLKDPNGRINLIHQQDCIQIIEEIIKQEVWGETFNACADTHLSKFFFYSRLYQKEGKTLYIIDQEEISSYKIISSQKLIDQLNYRFVYNELME